MGAFYDWPMDVRMKHLLINFSSLYIEDKAKGYYCFEKIIAADNIIRVVPFKGTIFNYDHYLSLYELLGVFANKNSMMESVNQVAGAGEDSLQWVGGLKKNTNTWEAYVFKENIVVPTIDFVTESSKGVLFVEMDDYDGEVSKVDYVPWNPFFENRPLYFYFGNDNYCKLPFKAPSSFDVYSNTEERTLWDLINVEQISYFHRTI